MRSLILSFMLFLPVVVLGFFDDACDIKRNWTVNYYTLMHVYSLDCCRLQTLQFENNSGRLFVESACPFVNKREASPYTATYGYSRLYLDECMAYNSSGKAFTDISDPKNTPLDVNNPKTINITQACVFDKNETKLHQSSRNETLYVGLKSICKGSAVDGNLPTTFIYGYEGRLACNKHVSLDSSHASGDFEKTGCHDYHLVPGKYDKDHVQHGAMLSANCDTYFDPHKNPQETHHSFLDLAECFGYYASSDDNDFGKGNNTRFPRVVEAVRKCETSHMIWDNATTGLTIPCGNDAMITNISVPLSNFVRNENGVLACYNVTGYIAPDELSPNPYSTMTVSPRKRMAVRHGMLVEADSV